MAEAVIPVPAPFTLATRSANEPLPVLTLVAVREPVASSELFTWDWALLPTRVAATDPFGPVRVTLWPAAMFVSVVLVPSRLTMPSTPVVADVMAESPSVDRADPPVICRLWLLPWLRVERMRCPAES